MGVAIGRLRVLPIALIAALTVPNLAATGAGPTDQRGVRTVAPKLPAGFTDSVVANVAAPTALTSPPTAAWWSPAKGAG